MGLKGAIKLPVYKGKYIMRFKNQLVRGVGLNDAGYAIQKIEYITLDGKRKRKLVWSCPYYASWCAMLKRCYSKNKLKDYPSYSDCHVCPDWLLFSNFKKWMQTQDWEGKQLDKDLLIRDNKLYSPETCCFISRKVNGFMVEQNSSRGEWPLGVIWHKRDEKFMAKCNNPFTRKSEHFGYFDDPLVAHKAWLTRKLELAKELSKTISDPDIAEALIKRYS